MHVCDAEHLNCYYQPMLYITQGGFIGLIMGLIPSRELQWMETHE